MNTIEQAMRRLEQLKQAGIQLPGGGSTPEAEPPSATKSKVAHTATVFGIGGQGAGADLHTDAMPRPRPARPEGAPTAVHARPSATANARPRHPGKQSKSVTLDLAHLGKRGLITADAPRSQLAEEYRIIKRPLIANAKGKGAAPVENGNLIMVTSSLPGEGKSFSSVNLALSIAAEMDNTVLLVDADVARPSLARVLGLPEHRGLMDVLSDGDDLAEVMLKTNVEKLSLLLAGSQHHQSTEMLASEHMLKLVREMATRYPDRIIIFDSPPLLVTTEARALAAHMGQVVLVIEAEKTTHSAVRQAVATLEGCPVVMAMLNKSTAQAATDYYGYQGYGYGYGYGAYGYGKTEPEGEGQANAA